MQTSSQHSPRQPTALVQNSTIASQRCHDDNRTSTATVTADTYFCAATSLHHGAPRYLVRSSMTQYKNCSTMTRGERYPEAKQESAPRPPTHTITHRLQSRQHDSIQRVSCKRDTPTQIAHTVVLQTHKSGHGDPQQTSNDGHGIQPTSQKKR